ncbi:MAG: serine/threonine protein kinase [Deltaproteobacteria bacterium]|nr:MAG: serine/threonine protein kinase [Deltaproteobacteria bacterium]
MLVLGKKEAVFLTVEDPRIGEQIQDYRLEKRLASGGMGTIFLAQRAPNSGSERSILRVFKLLRPELANDEQGIHLFRREVQILQQLHHPNIVQLEDHGIHDTMGRYICMEYITGHTLKTHLRRNPNPPKHALVVRWIQQICEALSYCHQKQIVHRDLKPENIFLQAPDTPAEMLKLFDFGIASCPNVDEIPARHVGTPRYMPPEQIRSEPVDGRADLYALGVILYELLTHRPLFAEKNSERLRQAHLNQAPPTLGERRPDLVIPDSVESMFQQLLAKSPDERPANAQAFVALWKECLPPEPFERRGGKMGFVVGQDSADLSSMEDVDTPPPIENLDNFDGDEWDEEFHSGSFWQTYKWPLMFLLLALVGLVAVVWGMRS